MSNRVNLDGKYVLYPFKYILGMCDKKNVFVLGIINNKSKLNLFWKIIGF